MGRISGTKGGSALVANGMRGIGTAACARLVRRRLVIPATAFPAKIIPRVFFHRMKSRPSLFWLFCLFLTQSGWSLDLLPADEDHPSPDGRWKVWVVKHPEQGDFFAEIRLSEVGALESEQLAKNNRHFGAEWSPDSKTLLVYDNFGSGNSDVTVYRLTSTGWMEICRTNGGFHVVWRLGKWLRAGVRLHATAGGSAAKIPPDFTISFDPQEPEGAEEKVTPAK